MSPFLQSIIENQILAPIHHAAIPAKNDWLKQPLRGYFSFSELKLQAGERYDAFYVIIYNIMFSCCRFLFWFEA